MRSTSSENLALRSTYQHVHFYLKNIFNGIGKLIGLTPFGIHVVDLSSLTFFKLLLFAIRHWYAYGYFFIVINHNWRNGCDSDVGGRIIQPGQDGNVFHADV